MIGEVFNSVSIMDIVIKWYVSTGLVGEEFIEWWTTQTEHEKHKKVIAILQDKFKTKDINHV